MLRGHTGSLVTVAWHPNGQRLATTSFDRTVKIWDATLGEETLTLRHDDQVWSVEWTRDGQRLGSIARDGKIRIWDATAGYELERFGRSMETIESQPSE